MRIYEGNKDNYSCSFQMFVEGKIGTVYGLNGSGFLKAIPLHVRNIMNDLSVDVVIFTMLPVAFHALSRSLKGIATLTAVRKFENYQREMLEVRLELGETL